MQGNGNLVRTFKKKDKDVRFDPKRDKNRTKDMIKRERKLKRRVSDDDGT